MRADAILVLAAVVLILKRQWWHIGISVGGGSEGAVASAGTAWGAKTRHVGYLLVRGASGEGRGGAVRGARGAAATRVTVAEVARSSLCFSGDVDLGKRFSVSNYDTRLISFHCTGL